MTKADMVAAVADKLDLSKKQAEIAVDTVFNTVMDGLKANDKVVISGFGSFEVRTRAARTGRNPRTGEDITIPEQKTPAFKAGKQLKDSVK
jgi:DNA-binding protein HU-beta